MAVHLVTQFWWHVHLVTNTYIWWPIILVTRTFGYETYGDKLWETTGIKMFLPWTIRSYQTTSTWTLLPKLVKHTNVTVNKYFYRSWRLKYSQIPCNILEICSLINLQESWLFSFDIRIACGEQIYLSPIIRSADSTSPNLSVTKTNCHQNVFSPFVGVSICFRNMYGHGVKPIPIIKIRFTHGGNCSKSERTSTCLREFLKSPSL